jgi:large subunit ribosomal protein L5
MVPRLLEKYKKEIVPEMIKSFGFKNNSEVPRLEKIVINMGVGEALTDIKMLDKAMEELGIITGQKPIMRRARKAISNFKVKQGSPVGCKVTLRKVMMYEFLDRMINIALPRLRDFRGVSKDSFDKAGNFNLGLNEQTIFAEIDYDKVTRVQGMNITIAISNSKSSEQSQKLLKLFGMPFQEEKES